jgi:hypothetical protein
MLPDDYTPPPASKTQDTASHHTSPNKADATQKPLTPPKKIVKSTGSWKLPAYTTKHTNPVGRPKTPRG